MLHPTVSLDGRILAIEGEKNDSIAQVLTWLLLQSHLNRALFVIDDESTTRRLTQQARAFGAGARFLEYRDLSINSARLSSRRVVILVDPRKTLWATPMKGLIDGGLVRVLKDNLWKKLIIITDGVGPVETKPIPDLKSVMVGLSKDADMDDRQTWLYELLLTLAYRRHLTRRQLLEGVGSSVYAAGLDSSSEAMAAITNLAKAKLIQIKRSHYSDTHVGLTIIDQEIPFSQVNSRLQPDSAEEDSESSRAREYHSEGWEAGREQYAKEAALELIGRQKWATVSDFAQVALRENITNRQSLPHARRILDSLVKENRLSRGLYVRGVGRPSLIYFDSNRGQEWLESRCGECALYIREQNRCRLWWALNRYDQQVLYSQPEVLSRMAHEKLRYGVRNLAPSATACEYFAARKRDVPIRTTKEECSGCGARTDISLVHSVRCDNCKTVYRPVKNKILVLYDYEHLFRERYAKVAGKPPPEMAMETDRKNAEYKELIVLYPTERVTFKADGIQVNRDKVTSFERYDRIYRVLDYGALSRGDIVKFEKHAVAVTSMRFSENLTDVKRLYPSSEFIERVRFTRENNSAFLSSLAEALLSSVIIATRRLYSSTRIEPWALPIQRQLLELARMKQRTDWDLDRFLSFEARINAGYWLAYKFQLKPVGLDFRSRVKDRFVREVVRSIRARARGYSPANAAINYLHQRRLRQCRASNSKIGLGWIGCEGLLHVAQRKPPIGLLLDLADTFKLADREALLRAFLDSKLTRDDFTVGLGRQRMPFYFPTVEGLEKLEEIGERADAISVYYENRDLKLSDAYEVYASAFKNTVEKGDYGNLRFFVYGTSEDQEWLHRSLWL